ncbi:hypothetical protein J6590_037127 [Homalodisca vitripennis]|nr:hypothetical protein J6590_037127 [Homalodisca vitripennis]
MTAIEPNSKKNLVSRFRTCGINSVCTAQLLKTRREEKTVDREQSKRPKAVHVPVGKSIVSDDVKPVHDVGSSPSWAFWAGQRGRIFLAKKQEIYQTLQKTYDKEEFRSDIDKDFEADKNVMQLCGSLCLDFDKGDSSPMLSSDESLPDEIEPTNIDPCLHMYYTVYYDLDWYVGRVIDFPDEGVRKVKFLKVLNNFKWLVHDDIKTVANKCVFYGASKLDGNGPFIILCGQLSKIRLVYNKVKKSFKISFIKLH